MRRPLILALVLLGPALLVLGIWLGGHPRWLPDPVADALLGDQGARTVAEALDEIDRKYYREVGDAALADAAIAGAVTKLDDRFSAYFTPKEYADFQDATNSRFSGVGLAVRGVGRGLRVQTVYDDSPAQRAGIRVGDVITAAGGRSLAGRPEQAGTARIKGPAGTVVTLRIRRGGRTLTKRVTRATISVPVVASELRRAGGQRVSHIALATFSSGAHGEVSTAIRRARARGAKGIVFDLRGNGGGLVKEAQLIASDFLPDGPIVTTRGRAVPERTLNAVGQPVAGTLPTVVLVDGGTASASEIVAGALQDRRRARVVGVKTFGKGVFQEVIPLSNGGALDITVGQYFTPSGRNLGGGGVKTGAGIKPDVRAQDDPDTRRDEALAAALDVLARRL
jgi:carboxyl-terminal processing protease